MKTLPVGELKTHFSEAMESVRKGEKICVLYGKKKKPIAMIVPYTIQKKKQRKIGLLDGKVKVKFSPHFTITEEEFLHEISS